MFTQPKLSKSGKEIIKSQGPFSVLKDHTDYVRTIDYSVQKGSLFSASDDGQLYMWDLSAEKLIQKYSFHDNNQGPVRVEMQPEESKEESKEEQKIEEAVAAPIKEEYPVVSHHIDMLERSCCPSAMAASQQGNMVFVAYTDNSLHMIDTRVPGTQHQFRIGGHNGLIKSIFVSQDETAVFTGGMDGTMRLWDIGSRKVFVVYGSEDQANPNPDYSFHTQTIWSILPDVDDTSTIWTGGKDGKIFITDIEENKARCLLDGTKPITCIANDQINNKLWYGTEDSSI